MRSPSFAGLALCVVLLASIAPNALADPVSGRDAINEILRQFAEFKPSGLVLDTAKSLFWTLATVSLVWTMGMLIVRQDIGELLMELLRFTFFTGVFFWLLVNATEYAGGEGFVRDITSSFLVMSTGDPSDLSISGHAGELLSKGLRIFYIVINDTAHAAMADQLISGGIVILILIACSFIAAQFLVVLVMAWMLGYASIFLLGFGGARWTSPIAINFYKHVLALGAAMLALSFIGSVASGFFAVLEKASNIRSATQYPFLGIMLAGAVLMMVLSIKVPQLLYTMVTGSPLGLLASTAAVAGHAIISGGGAALASASNAFPSGSGHGGAGGPGSVMDAVQRSGSMGANSGADAFHVGGPSGSDPFGVARTADPYRHGRNSGSVFSEGLTTSSHGTATIASTAQARSSSIKDVPVGANLQTSGPQGGGVNDMAAGNKAAGEAEDPGHDDMWHVQESRTSSGSKISALAPDYEGEMEAIAIARLSSDGSGGVGGGAGHAFAEGPAVEARSSVAMFGETSHQEVAASANEPPAAEGQRIQSAQKHNSEEAVLDPTEFGMAESSLLPEPPSFATGAGSSKVTTSMENASRISMSQPLAEAPDEARSEVRASLGSAAEPTSFQDGNASISGAASVSAVSVGVDSEMRSSAIGTPGSSLTPDVADAIVTPSENESLASRQEGEWMTMANEMPGHTSNATSSNLRPEEGASSREVPSPIVHTANDAPGVDVASVKTSSGAASVRSDDVLADLAPVAATEGAAPAASGGAAAPIHLTDSGDATSRGMPQETEGLRFDPPSAPSENRVPSSAAGSAGSPRTSHIAEPIASVAGSDGVDAERKGEPAKGIADEATGHTSVEASAKLPADEYTTIGEAMTKDAHRPHGVPDADAVSGDAISRLPGASVEEDAVPDLKPPSTETAPSPRSDT